MATAVIGDKPLRFTTSSLLTIRQPAYTYHRITRVMKNEFLFDYEVRVTEPAGERIITIGYSPNHEEAVKRALSSHTTATAAVVISTVEARSRLYPAHGAF